MSNVLIGIIGVILFIGLALGAALFLGPRFQDAQDNATASEFVSGVSMVASAVSSYRLATQSEGDADLVPGQMVTAGFLKSMPEYPIAGVDTQGLQMEIVDADGVDGANAADRDAWRPRFVVWSLGSSDGSREICTLVERKVGGLAAGAAVSDQTRSMGQVGNRSSGCYRTSTATENSSVGDYVVFARI